MEFKEKLPVWQNEGVEPPKSKQESGWIAGDQPPADWFNWMHHRTFKALSELRNGSGELYELIKEKADQKDVEEAIKDIPNVFHDASQSSITEDMNPIDFEHGITVCSQSTVNTFPTISEYGVTLTVRGANANYAQIFITRHGDVWARRSGVINSWNGGWYNAKKEIDKKVDWEDITNYASISDDKDTGEVTTKHTSQVNASTDSKASAVRSQVNASRGAEANGVGSQVNASTDSKATKTRSQVNSSSGSEASGPTSQVNASTDSKASITRSQVNASNESEANGVGSQVNASINSSTNSNLTVIIASDNSKINETDPKYHRNTVMLASSDFEFDPDNANDHKVVGGFEGDLSWMLDTRTGDIKASGKIEGNSTRADFAEYMESSSGKQLKTGSLVALDKGQKIRLAQEGDNPIGVISETAGLILNAQSYFWKNKYLHDRYGQILKVTKYNVYSDKDGNKELLRVYSEGEDIPQVGDLVNGRKVSDVRPVTTKQLNSDYKEDEDYIPREDREEWNIVGLKGQVYVNVDNTVKEHDFIQAGKNGIATKGNHLYKNWQVMEVTTPYTEKLGYGIARVII